MNTRFTLCFLLAAVSGHAATVEAVKGTSSAPAAQKLGPGSVVATKKSSQSQLRLNKGFVRLGSNSQVQMGREDQVQLKEGVMMVGSDGTRKRESVKVTAPGYSFSVQGTALIAYHPGSYIKITVLEGSIRVALQSLLGEFETLEAGQMLVINPADKRLPDPVEVDLNRLVTTSQLTGGALGPAPTDALIQDSITDQGGEMGAGGLSRTPFALRGASPEVTVFQLVNDLDDPSAIVNSKSYSPSDPDQFTTLSDVAIQRSGAKTRTLTVQLRSRPEDDGSTTLPSLGGNITVDADVFGGVPQKLIVDGDDTLLVLPGASVSTPGSTALELNARALDVRDATLRAGGGTRSSEGLTLIATGRDTSREFDLGIQGSTLQGGTFHMQGARGGGVQRIGVDDTQITAPRGITVGLSTVPSSITIRNSSELATLAGNIQFDSGGQAISVAGSTLRASRQNGRIVLDAQENGAVVDLLNATLNADVIKARGHSASGDAVIVDGGSFLARTVLKFYATGASILRFRGNVAIDSPLSVFSARTVEVELGGSVRSTGVVDIYVNTGQDRFNKPGFGSITTRTLEIPAGVDPNVLNFDSPTKPAF